MKRFPRNKEIAVVYPFVKNKTKKWLNVRCKGDLGVIVGRKEGGRKKDQCEARKLKGLSKESHQQKEQE